MRENGIRLTYLKIGLQSASKRINSNIFNRNLDKDFFIAKLKLLASCDVSVILDVISGNPYDNLTDKYETLLFYRDVIHSIRPLATIHRPVKIYDHKLMYYPGTKLYKKAMRDGMIPKNYINQVLRKRDTLRKHAEDLDNDTLVIALFNIAIRKSRFSRLAYCAIEILCRKPVFRLFTRLDIVRKGRRFSKVPVVDWLIRKMQKEGLW